MNLLLVPFMFVSLFLLAAAGFGYWAFMSREDYRANVNQKITLAVNAAKQNEDIIKDKQHAEIDKNPLKVYIGPEQFGSLHVWYPKSWSAYVIDTGNNNNPVDGYFQPGVVPSTLDRASIFALRVQVINQSYSTVVTSLNNHGADVTLTSKPYIFPKVKNVVGIRFDGTINRSNNVTGSMIVVPLRDKTLEIWTESTVYTADFNNLILPNITFSP